MAKCKCNSSTFIDEVTITRGTGRLSECGLWEFPCPHGNDMAEEWDERTKTFIPAAAPSVEQKGSEK